MHSSNTSKPERFGFKLHFPELRDAVNFVRMTGEGETIDVTIGSEFLTLARERNGIRCAADMPINWDSVPWTEQGLLFQTKIALFDRLLLRDIDWTEVLISGAYPAAAISENGTERSCLWRVKVSASKTDAPPQANGRGHATPDRATEAFDLHWPMQFLRSADPIRPTIPDFAPSVNTRSLSQAMRLLAQVVVAEPLRKGGFAAASIGGGQARVTGRAHRVIQGNGLGFDPIKVQSKHLNDLAYLLGRLPGDTRILTTDGLVSFVSARAHVSLQPASETPLDLSDVEQQLPLSEAEALATSLSSAIRKIATQAREKDDRIWWRMAGEPHRDVQLVLQVAGGEAMVTFPLMEGQHESVPALDYWFPSRLLTFLTPLGQVRTATLAFHPTILMSRQVDDGITVSTFIQALRGDT